MHLRAKYNLYNDEFARRVCKKCSVFFTIGESPHTLLTQQLMNWVIPPKSNIDIKASCKLWFQGILVSNISGVKYYWHPQHTTIDENTQLLHYYLFLATVMKISFNDEFRDTLSFQYKILHFVSIETVTHFKLLFPLCNTVQIKPHSLSFWRKISAVHKQSHFHTFFYASFFLFKASFGFVLWPLFHHYATFCHFIF